MAADDAEKRDEPEADPWADIVAESLDEVVAFAGLDASSEEEISSVEDVPPAGEAELADDVAASLLDAEGADGEEQAFGIVPFADVPAAVADQASGDDPVPFDADDAFAAALSAEGASADGQRDNGHADIGFEDLFGDVSADESPEIDAGDHAADHAGAGSTVQIGTGFSGIEFEESAVQPEGSDAAAAESKDAEDPWAALDRETAVADDADGVRFTVAGEEAMLAEANMTPELDADEFSTIAISSGGVSSGSGASGIDVDVDADESDVAFGNLAAVAAPVAATVATRAVAGRPARKGGIGQVIGIVLGALLAFPIVLGILIGLMWLGWPDKVGIRKAMPQALAFLLPPRSGPMAGPAAGGGAGQATSPQAISLDDVAALGADGSGTMASEVASPTEFTDAFAAADPAAPAAADSLPGIEPPADFGDLPAAANALAMAAVPGPADLDILGDLGIAEPADRGGLPAAAMDALVAPEAAVFILDDDALMGAAERAREDFAVVAEIEEFTDRADRKRLLDWYRSLARVGQELVVLEQTAADAGHPLAAPPDTIAELHEEIAAHPVLSGELGRLGRMWLRATSRDSDGIVMAGTFVAARRAGPWWISTIEVEEADGSVRNLSVVSRSEPDGVAGERIVATGMLFDDGVVWAGDMRPAAGRRVRVGEEPTADPVLDPFAEPAADVPVPLEF